MIVPDDYNLMRQWTVWIPQKTDGSGVVRLCMKAGSAKYFGLDKFPCPEDGTVSDPSGKYCFRRMPLSKSGANNGNFRLAYEQLPGRQKPSMVRFRLKGPWVMDTLAVITNYLNAGDVPWMYIANEFGNPVSHGSFRSTV